MRVFSGTFSSLSCFSSEGWLHPVYKEQKLPGSQSIRCTRLQSATSETECLHGTKFLDLDLDTDNFAPCKDIKKEIKELGPCHLHCPLSTRSGLSPVVVTPLIPC